MNYAVICVKWLCISGSGQPQEEKEAIVGEVGVSFGLIRPYFVEAERCPEGCALLGARGV